MTRKAGVTDDQDHLKSDTFSMAEDSTAYALQQHLERNKGRPFTGLTLSDYADTLTELYQNTPYWDDLASSIEGLRQPGYDPFATSPRHDNVGAPEADPGRYLYSAAMFYAGFIAYAKRSGLTPVPYRDAAEEWTVTTQQAYTEAAPLTDQEVRELLRDGENLSSEEIEHNRASLFEFHIDDYRQDLLRKKGLIHQDLPLSVELDPRTWQVASTETLRTLHPFYDLYDSSKLYGFLNAQSLWRVPAGKKAPLGFFDSMLKRVRAEQLLEQKKAGQADSELASLADAAITIPTGQIMSHMYAHVANAEAFTQTDIKRYHLGNNQAPVHIRATSQLDASATLLSPADEMLEQIHKSLLSIKTHGAALLKTQLDLMSEAYKAGGDSPLFQYNLAEALERQGYARREARGYSHAAMQGLRERVVTLASQRIDVLNISGTDKKGRTVKEIDRALYWVLELERVRQEGDTIGAATVLLNDPNASIVTGWTIRPGLWWPFARISDFHLHIPSSVLELPTHGNGHEAERLALPLTPALAIWERAGQNQHAGKDVSYKAGKLLEEARYVTRDEFMSMHPTAAKRIRDHLATLDGTGAIPLLDSLGAFALDIKDDADFFASGRGWREKFWEARIRVSVRDLQLPKRLPASPGKGTRSKRKRGK